MAPPAPRASKIGPGIKLLLGVGGLLVVAAVYYFFFYSDLTNAVANAQGQEAQLQSNLGAAAAAASAYDQDRALLERKKQKEKDLNNKLPETGEFASFLAKLNQQAEVAGLKVQNVGVQDEKVDQFYTRMPVNLTMVGKFHQIAKFFAGVAHGIERITNIENIELKIVPRTTADASADSDVTLLQAKCLATTFHANAKGVGSALPGVPGAPPGAPGAVPQPPAGAPK